MPLLQKQKSDLTRGTTWDLIVFYR